MKNIDYINSVVSTKLNRNKEIIKAVNSFYWREAAHRMTNLQDSTIFIKGFASFTASRFLLWEKIHETIRRIRKMSQATWYKDETKKEILERYYEQLRKLLKQRNELAKIYYEQRNQRIFKINSKSVEKCS